MLLAVEEAASLASAGRGGEASSRRSGKRKPVSVGRGGSDGDAVVASLLEMARAAMQSPLLPLSVPVTPSLSGLTEGKSGEVLGAGAIAVPGGEPNKPLDMDGKESDAPTTTVTAGVLLDAFVQCPAAVRRSIRRTMHRR